MSAKSPWRDPMVRTYGFVAAAAVLLSLLVMFLRDAPLGGMLATVVAVPGLIGRWSASPVLFFLIMGLFMVDPQGIMFLAPEAYGRFGPMPPTVRDQWRNAFDVLDLALVASIMVYLTAQYRLFSLVKRSFPPERTPFHRVTPDDVIEPKRPAKLVEDDEIPFMLVMAMGFVLGGQLLWLVLWELGGGTEGRFQGATGVFVLTVWGLCVGMIVIASIFGYLRMRNATRDEAEAFLRDGMWEATYREQHRLHRWSVWYRKRKEG